ncbi:MAG: 16S rRNA (adenine(1518)-N(6)/adenine(1519)-N(6))-dimethyltransferase RsmA [Saccharospirillaceae bacterium]|nr:16S rRNA (adenine(1518)-N(6)/adenine(1519)-N(6))-dimethyltransferase RsmA [Pseudomonadales bacterium]NRB80477.1 16S rRNA (adenine(1518)-N(6)/adenine(1519)-N(6))-dimethyltransferase RsmA [Saccharospirillaceae bacterium]
MHKARKRFGQNFLHDQGVIDRIVRCIHPKENENVVEIGPGQGALTEGLLDGGKKLDAIELDRDLYPILRAKFFKYEDFVIHEADALKFDFASLGKAPLRIVGNLPYNISSPLIFHLLKFTHLITDMHFMLQKEMVERLCAVPSTKDYGRITVMVQYHCDTEFLFLVGPESFDPAPKVDSAIIRLTLKKEKRIVDDELLFSEIVRTSFAQRRKTLRNNLKTIITAEQLESININPTLRPENITLDQFIDISNLYGKIKIENEASDESDEIEDVR